MTTRHTIIDTSGPEAVDWIEVVMRHGSYEDFVAKTLEAGHVADEEGREVSSYSPDDSQVDVFIPQGHFIVTFNLVEKTFVLEEVRGG